MREIARIGTSSIKIKSFCFLTGEITEVIISWLDFSKRSITSSTTSIIRFIIIRLSGSLTGEIAEFPKVFSSICQRNRAFSWTGLIVIKELIFLTRELAVFFTVDGVGDKRIHTSR
jgi:hypothetical protein